MANKLIRCTTKDGLLRGIAVEMTEAVEEARKRHDTWPTASAALGRGLISAALLSTGLKNDDSLTIRIFGDGPLGGIITQCYADGAIRGYVQEPHTHLPQNELGKLDVACAVGKNGFIYITKDIGLGEPYTGSTPMISGEIGEDLAYYLLKSEQIPSLIAIGVLVNPDNSVSAAGGVMVQALPGATDEIIGLVEQAIQQMKSVSTQISEDKDVFKLMDTVFKNLEYDVLEEKEVRFNCNCSRERLEKVLISLGEEEIESIINEQKNCELNCHFCNERYNFDEESLKAILQEIVNGK